MIITCEACGTSFKLKTSLVKETGSTVRCSKCQHVFIVYSASAGIEKPAFALDESLEAKIENVLGDEFDDDFGDIESEISLKTADISMTASDEKTSGSTFEDEFGDFESEVALETAEISMATSEDLFDSTASLLDALEEGSEEPEILMSDLLQEDDVVSMDDLVSGNTSEPVNINDLLADNGDSSPDIMSFEDFSSETAEEIEDDDQGALLEDTDDSEIVSFSDIEKMDDGVMHDAMTEESAQDEQVVAFDDLESEETFEKSVAETPPDEEEMDFTDFEDEIETGGKTEPDKVLVETEGGVDVNLSEFDVTKEPEKEKPAKKTGKPEPEKKTAIPADEEDFDLDFDLDAEETLAVEDKKEAKADDLDLDFDLDEPGIAVSEPKKTGAEVESFEMDLDLDLDKDMGLEDKKEAVSAAADEEDFDLDFDLDAEETLAVEDKKEAKADDLDLDLDFDLDAEETPAVKDKKEAKADDLDLEGFEDMDLTEASSESSIEDDLGLDLDEFDNLDLEEDLEKESSAAREETMEDFDLNLDLDDKPKQPSVAEAEKDDFDLDFDLDAEVPDKIAATAEDEFSLDLDIEPEAVEAKEDTGDFELDLEDAFEDKTITVSETQTGHKSEELDLTQIEDILDFDEAPKPKTVTARAAAKTMGPELEETELYTASNEDEMNIDLETMLDEEDSAGKDRKEVSLETVEQREKQAEKQYRKTVIEEEPAPEEVFEEPSREFDNAFKAAAPAAIMAGMAGKEPGRNLKKIGVGVLLLIIIGAIGFFAWKMLGSKETPPSVPPAVKEQVKDMGNLQMEMVDTPAYAFVENKTSGELLVITGNVTNRYDHPRSNVQVKGTLYNNAGKVIISTAVYCGNMFTDADLTDLDIKTIEGRLNNRMGDNQMNSGIKPGQSVPFTVVFNNLPADMSEFTIEVTASAR